MPIFTKTKNENKKIKKKENEKFEKIALLCSYAFLNSHRWVYGVKLRLWFSKFTFWW